MNANKHKYKYYLLCFSTVVVAAFICSFVPLSATHSAYVITGRNLPDFHGGAICARPNGPCRKCCFKPHCYSSFEPPCSDYSANQTKCLDSGTYETQRLSETNGYSCEDTGDTAWRCDKSKWGNCAKRFKCYWITVASCCAADSNNWYYRQSYLTCVTSRV